MIMSGHQTYFKLNRTYNVFLAENSTRSPGFSPRIFYVRFMAEIAALGQVDLGVPWSFLAGIKLLMVFTHSFTYS
jgi:hypothetical protein